MIVSINVCLSITAVVPVLLEALQDPTARTVIALRKLLDTKFVHFIDAPSLALIMPVVQRAFTDRAADTRKMAAQIVRNMYSLTDEKVRHCIVFFSVCYCPYYFIVSHQESRSMYVFYVQYSFRDSSLTWSISTNVAYLN